LLFDEPAREEASRHAGESQFRWLALSDDPEAVALRAGLQRCFELADSGRSALRGALMHERWGQHVGALAHLLTLGMLAAQDWRVHNEPDFGAKSPDILATRGADAGRGAESGADGGPGAAGGAAGGERLLVEVRAITGAGSFPWERRRESGRTLAHDPAKEQVVLDTVAKVLARKAESYRQLVQQLRIPFLICIYEDKDSELSRLVRELGFGRGAGADQRGERADARDPEGGAFADRAGLGHLSGVIVLRRLDTPDGRLLLAGDLIENPGAEVPLPPAALPLLRPYRLDATFAPPRMRFAAPETRPVAL
ncbi:MAG TPA: hypothetical protein VFD43_03995, partial [Planctomycetota bacterium]|nr:hypothetical protein [Planctomycetota bacterium]